MPQVVLTGADPRHGGGVASFCDNLMLGLEKLGVHAQRVNTGAGLGTNLTLRSGFRGLGALAQSFGRLAIRSRSSRVTHLNTSFKKKALIRDAILMSLAAQRGGGTVVQFHGGAPSDISDRFGLTALRLLMRADAIVVINQIQFNELLERWPDLKSKMHLVENGVGIEPLSIGSLVVNRLKEPQLLFLGRLIEGKGLLQAIHAVSKLTSGGCNITLSVAGDGPVLGAARELVRELGLQNQVFFHGYVGSEERARLLLESSVLLFPSSLTEGLPMVLLEALSYGIPIVAGDIPSLSTVVRNGRNGMIVDPASPDAIADGVLAVLENPRLYRSMSLRNRALAENRFNGDKVAEKFSWLYARIASNHAKLR